MNPHVAVRFLAPIIVAVILGPLAVSVPLWLADIASDVINHKSSSLADDGGLLVFLVIMTYFIGWPIALLAGLLVSLWTIRRPPSWLAVNAAVVIATVFFMGIAATGILGPVEENNGRNNLMFTLVAAIFAANVCWFLMLRLLRPAMTRAPANSPSGSI